MSMRGLKVWQALNPISLDEMEEVSLMNRVDTKYLIPEGLLPELLERVQDGYRVQTVEGMPVSRYNTTYFDTPDMEMYRMHHDGRLCRKKVRVRTYVDSSLSFLEVKKKSNKGRTSKDRIALDSADSPDPRKDPRDFKGDGLAMGFIHRSAGYVPALLQPQILNQFERVTLVNYGKTERLTIDGGLYFFNYQTGLDRYIPGLVVVELKQDGQVPSQFRNLLAEYKIQPQSFSKYCLGAALTNSDVKQNRFKSKIRYINKLTNNQYDTFR